MRTLLGPALVVCSLVLGACADDYVWHQAESGNVDERGRTEAPPPRKVLAGAKQALRSGDGAYNLTVYGSGMDSPLVWERVMFDLEAEIVDMVRTRHSSELLGKQTDDLVMYVRASEEGRYLQVEDWGPWDGCWLRLDTPVTAGLLGMDLGEIPVIPTGAVLVLDARVERRNRQAADTLGAEQGRTHPVAVLSTADPARISTDVRITVDLLTALQAFAMNTQVLLDLPEAAYALRVPAELTVDGNGEAQRLQLDGAGIPRAARSAGVELDEELRGFLPHLSAVVSYQDPGAPVEFRAPAPDLVLPEGASSETSCTAS